MIIDSKGKLFGKISIIDVVVILIILMSVSLVGYKYVESKTSGTPKSKLETIQLKIYAGEVYEPLVKKVKLGMEVFDSTRETSFGKLKSMEVGESISWGLNSEGHWVSAPREGYVKIVVIVEGKGKIIKGDNGVTFNNYDYYIGDVIDRFRVGNILLPYGLKIVDIVKR